ncbi:hypothetical protein METHB2_260020 [Candidatus Methylobacter favarea]|uniref:Uncharacterized protein n=1 Tax=Candidatus Methylobacter favarea TaxID=2707345 RepID=A0A8S0Y9U5_9GAMM|nr:hypothetical protein [Candidatus Methylobacter favarea]CAA9890641.1 hypothetical protein METHB2_260020 [Candidatus Methylobacter favarea]
MPIDECLRWLQAPGEISVARQCEQSQAHRTADGGDEGAWARRVIPSRTLAKVTLSTESIGMCWTLLRSKRRSR